MRFGDLAGLTSLPIERVKHRFRHEDVLTVLPVTSAVAEREALLVATAFKLAILTTVEHPESDQWMTQWASWDTVGLAVEGTLAAATEEETYGLTVDVGGLTFHARLWGPEGQRALRDFVVATQARQAAPASPH
jgi:hypothetical protein